ncbi:M43 family zinc metalloprotease [Bradyrhizobium sp. sBnM-33]|uniref:M43 family zinc metalloprotease n=1 Tax=Bradyrhizobium sp. sBnM-33 TaxID=2831780 RepID=UPI001BD03028|nr:M43 family zinc metalloprotease [Bradyrhizobium sp. sBnM-33]WOH48856.1 M43 family zinc metalloprotease [Bradyrhizobium sp. sBnM-33]
MNDYTSILSGDTWSGRGATGTPVFITFSFESVPQPYLSANYSQRFINSFQTFSPEDRDLAREALRQWGEACGIQFLEVAAGEGDIRFGRYNFDYTPNNASNSGFAYYPSRAIADTYITESLLGGDVFVNTQYSNSVYLLLHEIGHALGFKHTFDGTTTLDPALDNHTNTVMSYTGGLVDVLGPLDIQAAQYVYGTPSADGTHLASWSWSAATATLTQTGKATADKIFGTSIKDVIDGAGGNDQIGGFGGNDMLRGGVGADHVFGGAGNDVIAGGAGDDLLYGGNYWGDSAAGSDTLDYSAATTSVTLFFDAQWNGTLWYNATGSDIGTDLTYDFANAIMGAGNDTVTGNADANRIDGRGGTDTMRGGDGDDTYVIDRVSDVIIELANGGTDTLEVGFTYSGRPANVEIVQLVGTSAIDLTGSTYDDVLNGNSATNTILGGIGADVIAGGGGKDLMTGGAGLDRMVASSLADSGVAFAFRDVINTFAHGDKIDVSMIDANSLAAGNQAFTFVSAFAGVAGQLQWDLTNISPTGVKGYLAQGDVNGDGAADFSLQVYTSPTNNLPGGSAGWNLAAWDFIL